MHGQFDIPLIEYPGPGLKFTQLARRSFHVAVSARHLELDLRSTSVYNR